jgi:hypothetical protein
MYVLEFGFVFKVVMVEVCMADEKRLSAIRVPSSYNKIEIGEDDVSKRDALLPHDGKFALISDEHDCSPGGYLFGRLKISSRDGECYEFERIRQDGSVKKQRQHYHDLEGVLVQGFGTLFMHEFPPK